MGIKEKEEKPVYYAGGSGFGKRHVLMIWLFTGFINSYILRVCMNTAIVSMVYKNETVDTSKNVTTDDNEVICPFPEVTNTTAPKKPLGEFNWDKNTQGLILSSFFYGYICTQLIGGYLPRLIGGRLLFGISIAGTAALTLVHPIAARTSVYFLIALSILDGVFQGLNFPCNSFLCANWIPKKERSTLGTLPPTGTFLGTIIAAALTGVLCEYGFDNGWPSAFYIWGSLGLIWSAGWFWAVRDSPAVHPTISAAERAYIEANCQGASKPVPFCKIPWKSIFTSVPVWALIVAHTCFNWNYYTLLTEMSIYLKDVLHIAASLNGVVTSIPYLVMLVTALSSSYISDIVRARGVPTKWARKAAYVLGMIGSSVILIVLGYAGCNTPVIIVLLCIAIGFAGFAYSGFIVNSLDIAPQYAGILMGITNTFATMSGIVSPIVASKILSEKSTISTWQTVFYISAGVSVFGAIVYFLFSDGEVQEWAVVKQKEEPSKEKKELPYVPEFISMPTIQPALTMMEEDGAIDYF